MTFKLTKPHSRPQVLSLIAKKGVHHQGWWEAIAILANVRMTFKKYLST